MDEQNPTATKSVVKKNKVMERRLSKDLDTFALALNESLNQIDSEVKDIKCTSSGNQTLEAESHGLGPRAMALRRGSEDVQNLKDAQELQHLSANKGRRMSCPVTTITPAPQEGSSTPYPPRSMASQRNAGSVIKEIQSRKPRSSSQLKVDPRTSSERRPKRQNSITEDERPNVDPDGLANLDQCRYLRKGSGDQEDLDLDDIFGKK